MSDKSKHSDIEICLTRNFFNYQLTSKTMKNGQNYSQMRNFIRSQQQASAVKEKNYEMKVF